MSTTKLIFIHGAPSAGKLTVANAINNLVPCALQDNHIFIDYAKSALKFGAPGFFDLVRESRILAIRYATKYQVPLIVCTSCYSDPEDRPHLEEIESILSEYGGELLPVFLHSTKEVQNSRVGNKDRVQRGKVTSVDALDKFSKDWNFVQMPRENCFIVDTSILSPEEVSKDILKNFKII